MQSCLELFGISESTELPCPAINVVKFKKELVNGVPESDEAYQINIDPKLY